MNIFTIALSDSLYAYNNTGIEYPKINLYIQAITGKRFDDTRVLKFGKGKVCVNIFVSIF